MSAPLLPGRVPAPRIAAVVERYCVEHEANPENIPNRWAKVHFCSPMTVLADEVGRTQDWVYRLMCGRYKTLTFDDADRLLCAMDLVHLWWSDLADIYYAAELVEFDQYARTMELRRLNKEAKQEKLQKVREQVAA